MIGGQKLRGERGLPHAGRAQHGHPELLGRRAGRHLDRRRHLHLAAAGRRSRGGREAVWRHHAAAVVGGPPARAGVSPGGAGGAHAKVLAGVGEGTAVVGVAELDAEKRKGNRELFNRDLSEFSFSIQLRTLQSDGTLLDFF